MKKQAVNTVKLGIFVLAGIFLLIFSLYVLGKNRSMFGAGFEIKAHFQSVNGLVAGNNVRYSGIQIGSVKEVAFVNDTLIEVTMNIQKKMAGIIRRNAVANLGTDGLIGNRLVNIAPGKGDAPLIQPGDLLPSKEEIDTDEMLQTLRRTNENISTISEELLNTVHQVSTSTQLGAILNDPSLSANIKAALEHLHDASQKASILMTNANRTLDMASKGNGTLATLLRDSTLSHELEQAVQKIQQIEASAEKLTADLNQVVASVEKDLNAGSGPVNTMLKDSIMAERLRRTMDNIEQGTAGFNKNMEALQHNFLLRRYFKKEAKKAGKEADKE